MTSFDDWRPVRRLLRDYIRDLDALVDDLLPASLTPEAVLSRLDAITRTEAFSEAANAIAKRMVTGVAVNNAKSWRAAARKSTRSREIYSALRDELNGPVGFKVQQMIRENAQQIRSIPPHLAERTTKYISQREMQGARAEVIEKELRGKLPGLAKSKVRLIARTEVGKSETAITRARAENIGLNYFQWQTAEDGRVRKSHRHLDQVLVAWGDLPQPEALIGEKSTLGKGAPGEFPNCRCVALPLVSLDEIKWPARVYTSGRIVRMTRAEFARRNSLPIAA